MLGCCPLLPSAFSPFSSFRFFVSFVVQLPITCDDGVPQRSQLVDLDLDDVAGLQEHPAACGPCRLPAGFRVNQVSRLGADPIDR